MTLRPDRFCNYVYSWVRPKVEDPVQLDMDLQAPLPGKAAEPPTEAQLEQEGAEFMALMGSVNGGAG